MNVRCCRVKICTASHLMVIVLIFFLTRTELWRGAPTFYSFSPYENPGCAPIATCCNLSYICNVLIIFFNYSDTTKITYYLSTFRLHVGREAIWIRKTDNMNRDEGSYQLSHVWDKLLHTDDRHRKSVLMKASDVKPK